MSSSLSLALRRRGDAAEGSTLHLPPTTGGEDVPKYHPAPSRNEVSIVQPVLVGTLKVVRKKKIPHLHSL